jgi:hypothetical protein
MNDLENPNEAPSNGDFVEFVTQETMRDSELPFYEGENTEE